jgi:outer membrane protein assembly factor BamB
MKKWFTTAVLSVITMAFLAAASHAVTSVIARHKTGDVLLKGTTSNTVVDSRGIIRLSPKTEKLNLGKELEDVWVIHTILADKTGTLYVGTSPGGKVIRVRDGKSDILYPKEPEKKEESRTRDPNAPQEEPQPNEHVFAMAFDVAGRVLAGVSGEKGKVLRISSGTEVIFENEKVRYIFAIALDKQNNIYLGTGPNGQLWKLDAFGQNPQLLCTLEDKNILSLIAGQDGFLYAGADTRGMVYKIDSTSGKVSVLFDSNQQEIASLVLGGDGKLFAAASSAETTGQPFQVASASKRPAGRPDASPEGSTSKTGGLSLKTANSDEQKTPPPAQSKPSLKLPAPKSVGCVYQISGEGFVTPIFEEQAIFYTLFEKGGRLLLGTGPKARLFSMDPKTEERTLVFEDKTSSQITAAAFDGKDVFLALANPAAIVCLKDAFADQGIYTSDLIDAGQPARWGKIQLDADIPEGCEILLATRSGNVGEPNDTTFSAWSSDVKITEPGSADCPVGRFCQYRLTLKTKNPAATPQVREISVAQAIPNLEPKVLTVVFQKPDKQKPSLLLIGAKAEDDNKDTLEFAFEYRKQGRQGWILLKDKVELPKCEWDSRTVEDGRYEVRVTTNDRLSNSEQTALSNSRISDPIVIDNTAPAITAMKVKIEGTAAGLELTVEDELSILGKVQYTVDSDTEWKSVLPVDGIFDSTKENVVFSVTELKKGEHVIAIRVADDIDNTMYKSYVIEIK